VVVVTFPPVLRLVATQIRCSRINERIPIVPRIFDRWLHLIEECIAGMFFARSEQTNIPSNEMLEKIV
jgi:hypothetical protein